MVDMTPAEIVFRGGSNPKRYAIIEDATGKCVNVVDWDAAAEPAWSPPPGHTAVQDDSREIDPLPPVVPSTASKLGLRNALVGLGLWAQVRTAIHADPEMSEQWDLVVEIHRENPLVVSLAAAFGWDDAQLDALFIAAG